MKRKREDNNKSEGIITWHESVAEPVAKKSRLEENQILLTQYQVMLIDDLVFCLLGRGRLDLAIGELQREFPDPSQLATALSHSRYKVVMWALEHANLKLDNEVKGL